MRRAIVLATAVAAVGCHPPPRAALVDEHVDLALRAGRVLDVATGRYSAPSVILVRDGKIVDVVPSTREARFVADTMIDASDATALPGFIDGHVHLGIGGPPVANALADLRAGFTTVVDLGARTLRIVAIRDSLSRIQATTPRVLAAGIWVGVKNGVCEFNGIGIAGAADAFRERIRANAAAGAEITKLCVSGWPAEAFTEPAKFEIPEDVLQASVTEAHALHRLVIAHDISLGGVQAAIRAGVDGLAHAAFLDAPTAAALRDHGVFMVSTLASLTAGDTSRVAPALVQSLALAHRTGVKIVFGTDGGVLPHGRNAAEFLALAGTGLTPLEAIRTATLNAAVAYRLADSVGAIRRGMVADLVLVRGDPLADLTMLAHPQLVLRAGHVVH